MSSEMSETFSRKLTGLSSEQMNVFNLKKSLECSTGLWNQMITGGFSKQDSLEYNQVREMCSLASTTFRNVIKSAEQQRDSGSLESFLSESVVTDYLHLIIVFYGAGTNKCDLLDNAILYVVAHCLESMESFDNCEKLVADFTEGIIYLIFISIRALHSIGNESTFSVMNILRFSTLYTNSLAAMSRKHNNRKKLYTVFCNSLLGPVLTMFQVMKSAELTPSVSKLQSSLLHDFTRALETLIENSLFHDDKNVEDLATAVSSALLFSIETKATSSKAENISENKSDNKSHKLNHSKSNNNKSENKSGEKQKEPASYKASYHSGIFDALAAVCSGIFSEQTARSSAHEISSITGYSEGISRLLLVYSKCSQRILSASLLNEQNHESKHSEAVPTGKPSTTLLERRKHTIRLLQVSLALLTIVDNACQKRIITVLEGGVEGDKGCHRELVSFLLTCVKTQKEVLQSLSFALDETGGYSILATHDSLQPFARRLSVLCNRALSGAASPLQAYISYSMTEAFMGEISNLTADTLRSIESSLLAAQSDEFDSVRILAGIDHRVITARSDETLDPSLESSPVLQAIAGTGEYTVGVMTSCSQLQVLGSKEELLLSVITLFNDLRRMDDFVLEVRGVCQSDSASLSTFVSLLGSQRVQDSLARSFAGLPVSQIELVWESLIRCNGETVVDWSTGGQMEKKCQSMIVRALVQATTLSSSTRHQDCDGKYSSSTYSCDDILQVGALISLATPLPAGIVGAMTSLFKESVMTLQLLEGGDAHCVDGHDQCGFIFDIISLLLQLGSAAIVLHRGRNDKDDIWLEFRECAGAAAAFVSVQRPVESGKLTGDKGCLPAAVVLLSLSAFTSTSDSLKLTILKSSRTITGNIDDSVPLSSKEIDEFVLELVRSSCEKCPFNTTETATKRKRKVNETETPHSSSSSVLAIDFLLLFSRSVSVWRHLPVGADVISALTLAHFKDMAPCYESEAPRNHAIFVKHTCFCRLMQLVTVQDCPVLVRGFLLAVESLVHSCSDTLTAQTSDPSSSSSSSARKPRVRASKASNDSFPVDAMCLVSNSFADSSAIPGMGVPVRDLLAASNAALGASPLSSQLPVSGSLYIIASIAQHSSSVIALLLPEFALSASDDHPNRLAALESAASVLLLCLQNRPSLSSSKPVTSASIPSRVFRGSKASPKGRIETEYESWDSVDNQLQTILKPLLAILSAERNSSSSVSLQSLAPLVIDFLLHNNLSSDVGSEDTEKAHRALSVVSDAVTDFLSGNKSKSSSGLQTCVEVYRRVSSYYCALPGDVITSSAAIITAKGVVERLMSVLLPLIDQKIVSQIDCLSVDACCFLAADSLRLYVKCTGEEADGCKAFLATISPPSLPASGTGLCVVLDGWFLLTGTILLLQRRSGNLLTVQGSFFLIEKMKQAILLAAVSSADNVAVREETLMSLTVSLQALVGSVPYTVRSAVGDMLLDLAQFCACSSSRASDRSFESAPELSVELASAISPVPSSSGTSGSSARLSRFVVLGVDCLLSAGGQYKNNFDVSGKETSSSLASARAVLECVAVSCTGSADMLARPEVVLAVVSALRRGITVIQQQQQRGRRKLKRARNQVPEAPEIPENDREEGEGSRGREHALSQWASCCFSVLSKIVPRLLRGNGGMRSSGEVSELSDRARVEISAHCLSVLEQLFACDSVGGSSLPLLGNSIGTLGALLTTAIRVIVAADEKSEERRISTDVLVVTNALRVAARMLTAASSSKELNRHAHVLAASVVDLLAQRPVSMNTRELLLPGLFALFDRCRQKQRLQMFATVNAQTRAVLSDLHGTYLRDFKFTGQ